jgi:cytochrome b561
MLKKMFLGLAVYATVCDRACLKRIQPMPNVPLAYVSVYRRMSDIFHTLTYACTIRNSVTGPLPGVFTGFYNYVI